MKKSLLIAAMMLAGATMFAQETVMVGDLSRPMPQSSFPIWTYYECSESEMIYTADDLINLDAGAISKMEFAVIGGQDLHTHMTLWVENTEDTSVGDTPCSTDNMQMVYDNSDLYLKKYDGATKDDPAYMEFAFTEPFQYTGGGIRVRMASISQYYCGSTFNFVADGNKITQHAGTKNGVIKYGYTQAGMNYKSGGTQFPVVKFTVTKTTGITAPVVEDVKEVTYYNVYGQKVDANTKGLIITSDGKKFINK